MLSCAVVDGAENGFDDIVRVISGQLHSRPVSIPFLGLLNLATFVAHPAGVKHLDLAVFENLDGRSSADIAETLHTAARGWKRFLQVRSWDRGERQTVIVYLSQEGIDCRLLLATLDPHKATVVELKLNPEALQVWLDGDRGVRGLRPLSKTPGNERVDGRFSRTEN
jgi:hypothetical protein